MITLPASFLLLTILPLATVGDREEVRDDHHRDRSTFEQKHMNAGKHDLDMDHKAILGSLEEKGRG